MLRVARALRIVRTAQRGGQGRPGGRACGVCVCAAPGSRTRQAFRGFCPLAFAKRVPGAGGSCHWKQIFFFNYFAIVCHRFPNTQRALRMDPVAGSSFFQSIPEDFLLR